MFAAWGHDKPPRTGRELVVVGVLGGDVEHSGVAGLASDEAVSRGDGGLTGRGTLLFKKQVFCAKRVNTAVNMAVALWRGT